MFSVFLNSALSLRRISTAEFVFAAFFLNIKDKMSDTDLAAAAVTIALIIKKRKKKRKREWMKERYQKRVCTPENVLNEGDLGDLCELMDAATFDKLLEMIAPAISKQNTLMRDAIPASQRLRITLKYLVTGNSFESLTFCSAISPQAISPIVMETCTAIINALDDYINLPGTEDQWLTIAEEIYEKFGFPNCLGAVDGVHIAIKKPTDPGLYFNYQKWFSIVLIAVVNANYEFIMVDASTNGNYSHPDPLANIKFGELLANNLLNAPENRFLSSMTNKLPFVFVGSDAFALRENFLKSYVKTEPATQEHFYNYCIKNVQRIAENALGIMGSKFRVLQNHIGLNPQKVRQIIGACCYLHNFLRRNQPGTYVNPCLVDSKDMKPGALIEGYWKGKGRIIGLQVPEGEYTCPDGNDVRYQYCKFLNKKGLVSWQTNLL